jgi:hypothetical protein
MQGVAPAGCTQAGTQLHKVWSAIAASTIPFIMAIYIPMLKTCRVQGEFNC